MGIKDNFSQAVKELWKKDGQDKGDDKKSQPSELDRYLQNGGQGNAAASDKELGGNGVPLETPYYRDSVTPQTTEQNAAKADTTAAGQGGAEQARSAQDPGFGAQQPGGQESRNEPRNFDRPQGGGQDAPPYNQNVQNARQANQSAQNSADNYSGYGGQGGYGNQGGYGGAQGGYGGSYNGGMGGDRGGYGGNPPSGGMPQERNETDEITVISKNTMIDGNVRSLANMQIDGNIKGNVETTRNIDMSGKVIGDITCNNAGMVSAAMQGNISLKGRMRMDRDTILIGDLSSQYADINGRIRGKMDIVGKAELKRDAVVFGDINASTIAVADGAIIQGYVNTTFLSKEDSRNVFPDAISIDSKEVKS